jgi:hypothetical protein
MTTWLLILYLQAGARVLELPDLASCIARSQFEMRFDARNRAAQCVPASIREA